MKQPYDDDEPYIMAAPPTGYFRRPLAIAVAVVLAWIALSVWLVYR